MQLCLRWVRIARLFTCLIVAWTLVAAGLLGAVSVLCWVRPVGGCLNYQHWRGRSQNSKQS